MSNPYDGQSTNVSVPGVSGENTAGGHGVRGTAVISSGVGVLGENTSGDNVHGTAVGVQGSSNVGIGMVGFGPIGVKGAGPIGVSGDGSAIGVQGTSTGGVGVYGESQQTDGISGHSHVAGHSGVWGDNTGQGFGVSGSSAQGTGVFGTSFTKGYSGVAAINDSGGGYGLWARGTPAGHFEGNVTVIGTITANVDFILGADCAEEFDVVAVGETEPGTVMVLDQQGALQPSQQAYDKKVAGIISGAGDYKPGIILDKKESSEGRMPVALVGKAYCKVDAQYAPIEVGDLLTTSPTPGYAMKADDPFKAFGSVIGKAMRPLQAGQGLIPILIALQ